LEREGETAEEDGDIEKFKVKVKSDSKNPRPDNCSGSFQENCDASRDYTNITQLITAAGKSSLLSYMQTYWQSDDESDEAFWEHEWSTHGTCYNTIDPSCYEGYTTGEEAVDFFQQVVNVFKTLDTYTVCDIFLPKVPRETKVTGEGERRTKEWEDKIITINPSFFELRLSPQLASPRRPPRPTPSPQSRALPLRSMAE
jgi:hypothetical protein